MEADSFLHCLAWLGLVAALLAAGVVAFSLLVSKVLPVRKHIAKVISISSGTERVDFLFSLFAW